MSSERVIRELTVWVNLLLLLVAIAVVIGFVFIEASRWHDIDKHPIFKGVIMTLGSGCYYVAIGTMFYKFLSTMLRKWRYDMLKNKQD